MGYYFIYRLVIIIDNGCLGLEGFKVYYYFRLGVVGVREDYGL